MTGVHLISVFLNRAAARRGETTKYDIVFSITEKAPTHPIYDDETGRGSMTSDYELGKTKGYQDGQAGLSRTPTRHEIVYSEANRAEFFRGYEDGYNEGIKPGAPTPASYGQPFTAVTGKGTVTIKEGSRTVAVCKTASPSIEQTRFIDEQNQIVVKSRANHGPATVELFSAHTGRLEGTVKAFELKNGGPNWAEGMAD
jgi:hypothetical protein